tara:strand:+ start:217 stop:1278 length:1062 start_codon:yes stop_codon:yes gene_type:complete
LSELHVIDLFSGIGGCSLGLHQADPRFKTIAFCEIDPFCQKVLKKNFPEVKIYGDIKKTTFTEPAFLVCGGFPCQSISIAGKQKGKDDDRWLFPEMLRVIKQVKPKWIIAENVQNLLNIADGKILQGIYNDLEALDYEIQTFRISAASQGAWHKRERVWIVGCLSNSDSNGKTKRGECSSDEKTSASRQHNEGRGDGNGGEGCFSGTWQSYSNEVSDSNSRLRGRRRTIGESGIDQEREFSTTQEKSECQTQNLWSKTIGCDALSGETENVTNTDNTGCEKQWQSESIEEKNQTTKFSSWWQTIAKIRGVPNGIQYELDKNRAKRIKALGNAIVPQIITELGKAIIKAEFNDG